MPELPTTPETVQTPPAAAPPPGRSQKKTLFLAAGIVVLFIIFIVAMVVTGIQSRQNTSTPSITPTDSPNTNESQSKSQPQPQSSTGSSYSLVYGSLGGMQVSIKAVDLSTQKTSLIAALPHTAKKITILSPEKLVYIAQTQDHTHGRQLVLYDIKNRKILNIIWADDGYGIEDYVVSPDKQSIAMWEITAGPDEQTLQGGSSRIYAIDLFHPSEKKLRYDEIAEPPGIVHYPNAILNDGKILTDKFLSTDDPYNNDIHIYGMSMSDSQGGSQDISQLRNGSYASPPVLSPDGQSLLFAGYDGTKEVLTPNTIELLDVTTMTRQKLPELPHPSTNTYTNIQWDIVTSNINLKIDSKDPSESGYYTFDVTTNKLKQLNIPYSSATPYILLSQLSDDSLLVGTQDTAPATLSNLGEEFSYAFNHIYTLTGKARSLQQIVIEDQLIQFIALVPAGYF